MTRAIALACGRLLLLGSAAGPAAMESRSPISAKMAVTAGSGLEKDGSGTFAAARPAKAPGELEIKGRLAPAPGGSGGSGGRMGFKSDAGAVYTLVSNGMSMALFVDTNLQSKMLLLKGRVRPGSQRFEVTGNLRSLRDGKVHELYYYCDICAIKGSEPGPCLCCREPVHLVEEPR